jgi:hypothetical protein
MKQENEDILDNYFSYGLIVRSPIREVEKLMEFVKAMPETKIICMNISMGNQWLTTEKPNRIIPPVINLGNMEDE